MLEALLLGRRCVLPKILGAEKNKAGLQHASEDG